MSHVSIPEVGPASTAHASPGLPGLASTDQHRVSFHSGPPSFAQALHASPSGQFCSITEQSSKVQCAKTPSGSAEHPPDVARNAPLSLLSDPCRPPVVDDSASRGFGPTAVRPGLGFGFGEGWVEHGTGREHQHARQGGSFQNRVRHQRSTQVAGRQKPRLEKLGFGASK